MAGRRQVDDGEPAVRKRHFSRCIDPDAGIVGSAMRDGIAHAAGYWRQAPPSDPLNPAKPANPHMRRLQLLGQRAGARLLKADSSPCTMPRSGARRRRWTVEGWKPMSRARSSTSAKVSGTSPACMGRRFFFASLPMAFSRLAIRRHERHRRVVADIVEPVGRLARSGIGGCAVPCRIGFGTRSATRITASVMSSM